MTEPLCGVDGCERGPMHRTTHAEDAPTPEPSAEADAALTEWAEDGRPTTPAQWAYELALIIAKARFGPGVDMGGKHNPLPTEQREARRFVDAMWAALSRPATPPLDVELRVAVREYMSYVAKLRVGGEAARKRVYAALAIPTPEPE